MIAKIISAAEAFGSALPFGLGAAVWLGSKLGAEVVGPLIFAMLLGLAVTNWIGAKNQRPMVYGVRVFEVSILVGFIDTVVPQLASWGLQDSTSTRVTLVLAVTVGAAVLQPLFFGFGLQRVTRLIPAPVFAGFLNAAAVVILISQVKQVLRLYDQDSSLALPSLGLALACFAVVYSVKKLRPQWPARILGLLLAAALGWLFASTGQALPSLVSTQLSWILPLHWLDLSAWFTSQANTAAILRQVVLASAFLAVVQFLNTVTAADNLAQLDDKRPGSKRQQQKMGLGQIVASALGAMPLSGSAAFSMAGMRTKGWGPAALAWLGVLALALHVLGWLALVPAASLIGLTVFEAYSLQHVASRQQLMALLRRPGVWRDLKPAQRGDLVTIALVVAAGAILNMVASLILGIICGLVIFALRNGKSPIQDIQRADILRSYCLRANADSVTLGSLGRQIVCVRLQGALFFGVAAQLREELERLIDDSRWVVIDWSRVSYSDSTVDNAMHALGRAATARHVTVLHSGRTGDSAAFIDLDRALEHAEDLLLAEHEKDSLADASQLTRSNLWFLRDLSDVDQATLLGCFERREFQAGEYLFRQGDLTQELYVLDKGSVNIVLGEGKLRLAAVRQGATLGEMAFLDGTPRFADGVAMESVQTYSLNRQAFDELARQRPELTQHLLLHFCSEIAERLRFANQKLYKQAAFPP